MTIVGCKKQERKIDEMGKAANDMYPDIDIMVFKGSFRYGVRSALKVCGFENWAEVAAQSRLVRKRFFETVLRESSSHLKKVGLKEAEIDDLVIRLTKENEKYLEIR